MSEEGAAEVTVQAVADRSGVSRPTLYRWWPSAAAIVLEALLEATAAGAPYGDSGDVVHDLREHAERYALLLAGPLGGAYRALFAQAQADPALREMLREQLVEPRRAVTREVLDRGMAAGRLRADLDVEAAIDQLYAPLLYRLLVGHGPLDAAAATALVEQAVAGLRP